MMAPSKVPIRILLIDDHAIVRNGVRLLLEGHPGVIVVGEADKCSDAIALARRERPDVIVLEFLQEEENGIDFIAELLNVSTQSRVLVLTGAADRNLHHRAVRLGAMGIVLKKKEPEVLFKAIEKIHQGEAWLDRCTIATVLARLSRPERDEDSAEAAKIKTLTKKDDRSVVSLLFL